MILIKKIVRWTRRHIFQIFYTKKIDRYCPICKRGQVGEYFPHYTNDVICAFCGSSSRHRFFWVYFKPILDELEDDANILHFAPEAYSKEIEKQIGDRYYTGDIQPGRAKYVLDITNIDFPENMFDVVLCSHVLEHIPDDLKAISELYRVLKPGGTAYLTVPTRGEKTDEDLSVVDPGERKKRFLQEDHVRVYGALDFEAQVRKVNFETSTLYPENFLPKDLKTLLAIPPMKGCEDPEFLLIAKKPKF